MLLVLSCEQHHKDWHSAVFASARIDANSHEERKLESETLRLMMEGSWMWFVDLVPKVAIVLTEYALMTKITSSTSSKACDFYIHY